MALTVYWTQFAEDKLEDIFHYYKLKAGIRVATKLVNGIVDQSMELVTNPEGKQLEEHLSDRPQDFRYVVFKKYKIVYYIDYPTNRIFICHVFDTRQNPEKIRLAR